MVCAPWAPLPRQGSSRGPNHPLHREHLKLGSTGYDVEFDPNAGCRRDTRTKTSNRRIRAPQANPGRGRLLSASDRESEQARRGRTRRARLRSPRTRGSVRAPHPGRLASFPFGSRRGDPVSGRSIPSAGDTAPAWLRRAEPVIVLGPSASAPLHTFSLPDEWHRPWYDSRCAVC